MIFYKNQVQSNALIYIDRVLKDLLNIVRFAKSSQKNYYILHFLMKKKQKN